MFELILFIREKRRSFFCMEMSCRSLAVIFVFKAAVVFKYTVVTVWTAYIEDLSVYRACACPLLLK